MKLFTIGPVEMDPETLSMGKEPLPYFRTSDFSRSMFGIENTMKEFIYTAPSSKFAILTASGSGAMEAAVINAFTERDKLLILNGGSFGARFVDIVRLHKIPYEEISLPFEEMLSEEILEQYSNKGFTGFLLNIHETSIGKLHPIQLISKFCKTNDMTLVVDAISSFLADEYYMDEWNIDITVFSSQKSLALPPGLSFVVVNDKTYKERIKNINSGVLYLDLENHFLNMERGQTPYTPAVGIVLQLEEKLNRIKKRGLSEFLKSISVIANDFRKKVETTSFQIPQFPLSNALTPIICPKENATEVFESLLNQYRITVTPSGGAAKERLLRVGHIGNLTTEDNSVLCSALSKF